MTLASAVSYFRQRQADLFVDECTVTRRSGEPTFDPGTGVITPATSTVYTGACLVRPAAREGMDRAAGETEVRLLDYVAKLPVDTAVTEGDVMTVTDSTYDAGLVGRTFRITDVLRDGWQIARVAVLEEVNE